MISNMEPSWVETISVNSSSKQVHLPQRNRAKPVLAESPLGAFTKFVGSNRLSRFLVAGFMSLITAAHFHSLLLSVPPAQAMAKRCRPLTGEPSKFTGASSKSERVGKIVLALAAVRHQQSSPFSSAQEQPQYDVKGHVNPSQASGDRLHSPGVGASGDRSHKVRQCDDPRQENPGQGFLVKPGIHTTRSFRFGRLQLDARERTAKCSIVIWTQGVS